MESRAVLIRVETSLARALSNVIAWAVNRSKMPRDPFAAWMHSLVLWGFIILFIGTTMVFLEHQTPLHFYYGTFYLIASAVLDLGGLAFLVGLTGRLPETSAPGSQIEIVSLGGRNAGPLDRNRCHRLPGGRGAHCGHFAEF